MKARKIELLIFEMKKKLIVLTYKNCHETANVKSAVLHFCSGFVVFDHANLVISFCGSKYLQKNIMKQVSLGVGFVQTEKVLATEFLRCDMNGVTIPHALCIEKNIVYYRHQFQRGVIWIQKTKAWRSRASDHTL